MAVGRRIMLHHVIKEKRYYQILEEQHTNIGHSQSVPQNGGISFQPPSETRSLSLTVLTEKLSFLALFLFCIMSVW